MNGRFVLTCALLAALALAGPTTAPAAETALSTATSTSADKAEEAKHLAAMAAELAQRAAQLEAESKAASTAAAATLPATNAASASSLWSPRGAAEVEITDAKDSAPSGSSSLSGWRRHRKPTEVAIRFMNHPTANATTQTAGPAIAAPANAATPAPIQTSSEATATLASAAAESKTESKPLADANVQLAASTYQDDDDIVPDTEPLPPAPTYTERNGGDNGQNGKYHGTGGDACGCGNGNCDGGCASGCCDCCEPPPMLFWTSGIEATYLNPDLNNDGVGFAVEEFASGREDYFTTLSDDTDSFYLAPRVWFGVQGCKWGANFRYFHLRANEGSYDPTLGSDGEWDGPNCGTPNFGYASCTDLEAYYIDLEITRRFCLNNCQMQFSGGVRHADLSYDELLSATALADDSQVFGFGTARRETRGTGFVFGWYGRRPVFPCSCIHWFYNIRASAVWGPTQTASETGVMLTLQTTDPDAVGNAGSVNGASTYVDDDMWIGEFQVGLEWDYALQCMPANAFCRLAFEYQRWTGGMGYTAANSFAGVEIDDGVNPPVASTFAESFASAAAPELDLLGIAVSAGLTW